MNSGRYMRHALPKSVYWQRLKKVYYLPDINTIRVTVDEVHALLRFANTFYCCPVLTVTLPQAPTSITIKDIHGLVCASALKLYGRFWPFKTPSNMHFLQNCLRIMNRDLFVSIFSSTVRRERLFVHQPILNVSSRDPSFFENVRKVNNRYYKALTESFVNENNQHVLEYKSPKKSKLLRQSLRCANKIQILEDRLARSANIFRAHGVKIKTYYEFLLPTVDERDAQHVLAYMNSATQAYSTVLTYDLAYENLATSNGLPLWRMTTMTIEKTTTLSKKGMVYTNFSDLYKRYVSSILEVKSNFLKILRLGKLVNIKDLTLDTFKEPKIELPIDERLDFTRIAVVLLRTYVLMTKLMLMQQNTKVAKMFDVYRLGLFGFARDSQLGFAKDIWERLMLSGIQHCFISYHSKFMLENVWYESIFSAYLSCKIGVLKMMLSRQITNQCDRLFIYASFACSVKAVCYLKYTQRNILDNKFNFKRKFFEQFIECLPPAGSCAFRFEEILKFAMSIFKDRTKEEIQVQVQALEEVATVYDLEIILESLKALLDNPLLDISLLRNTIGTATEIRKEWIEILSSVIQVPEEGLIIISQKIPNSRVRKFVKEKSQESETFLQAYLTIITCCELINFQTKNRHALLFEAIFTFLVDSEACPFYFCFIRELAFLLEGSLTSEYKYSHDIEKYLQSVANQDVDIPTALLNAYVTKKNYIHLMPHNIYAKVSPEIQAKIEETFNSSKFTIADENEYIFPDVLVKDGINFNTANCGCLLSATEITELQNEPEMPQLLQPMIMNGVPAHMVTRAVDELLKLHLRG